MRAERKHVFSLQEGRQISFEEANGEVHVLQTKTNQIVLLREGFGEVGAAHTHKHINVAGTKGQAFEGDVTNRRIIGRDVKQRFEYSRGRQVARQHGTSECIDGSIHTHTEEGIKPGRHVGGKSLTQ